MTIAPDLLIFKSRDEWRAWLIAHHSQATEATIVIYKNREALLSFEEAQEEALCFGWTDVKSQRIDETRYSLRFTPRRAGSNWSITNVQRVERAIASDRMTAAGLAKVTEARQNGQWEAAIKSAQTDLLPPDLEKALKGKKGALAGYRSLKDSRKRQLLHSLYTAKSEATRQRRIGAILQEVATL